MGVRMTFLTGFQNNIFICSFSENVYFINIVRHIKISTFC